jgi:hypothetical protein
VAADQLDVQTCDILPDHRPNLQSTSNWVLILDSVDRMSDIPEPTALLSLSFLGEVGFERGDDLVSASQLSRANSN